MLKLNTEFDADSCSTCSVTLNATTTQDTGSLNGVCCPHWLVQWSRHCSCMRIPVYSLRLPGYIGVVQTVLIILTMAGLFLDRPYTYMLHTHIFFKGDFLKKDWFIFKERGREVEREGEKHQCVVASCMSPSGDLAHNPGMCPDWESNQWHFGSQAGNQSTEPHQLGANFFTQWITVFYFHSFS